MHSKVAFIDRDGVINKDYVDFVKTWDEFEFIQGSLDALRLLHENGYMCIVVTNQSMINRKIVPINTLMWIHGKMKTEIAYHGGFINGIYYCPHTPEDNCMCRKPKPGLIQNACADFKLTKLDEYFVIGDSIRDMECGWNAGISKTILVRTGHGAETEKLLLNENNNKRPTYIADDLLNAVKFMVGKTEKTK